MKGSFHLELGLLALAPIRPVMGLDRLPVDLIQLV